MLAIMAHIFLFGDVSSQIVGNKLPTEKQVLRVLFSNIRQLKYSLRQSATLVVKEVWIFWEKAGIPVQTLHRCVEKVESLYNCWRSLQKRAGKKCNELKELDFKRRIDLLFDIACSPEASQGIDERIMAFLTNQRKPELIGFIGDIQTIYDENITAEEMGSIRERGRKAKYEREKSTIGMNIHFSYTILFLK